MDKLLIKDAQKFLKDRGITWDGSALYKGEHFVTELEGLDGAPKTSVFMRLNEVDLIIEKRFVKIDKDANELVTDYSFDWTKNMLEKYPERASHIKDLLEKKMTSVYDYYERAVKPYQEEIVKIKTAQAEDLKSLNELKKLAEMISKDQNNPQM